MTHRLANVGDLHFPVPRDLMPSAGKTPTSLALLAFMETSWVRPGEGIVNLGFSTERGPLAARTQPSAVATVATEAMAASPDAPASLPYVAITNADTINSRKRLP